MFSVGESDRDICKRIHEVLPIADANIFQEDEVLMGMPINCNGRTVHSLNGGQTIIRLKTKPFDAYTYGVLAHEIFHAVDFIMRRIGITLSSDSDEAYTYLMGYVTREFFKAIK